MNDSCLCGNTVSEMRRRVVRGGAIQFVGQCVNCGSTTCSPLSREAVMREYGTLDLPSFDDQIAKDWQASREKSVKQEIAEKKKQFFVWYDDYLKSPEWRSKRLKVLARSKGVCEGCGDAAATQVHHLNYDHVGDELLFELVAICDECHEKAHNDRERI